MSGTRFTAATKLLIRARAGNGDPEDALCEACAIWLGRYGGQCQHRVAGQMGGSRLRNGASNGLLLCGTPQSGDHGLCESRDRHMNAQGFWLWSWQDPRTEPVMLHGDGGGALVWLDGTGGYSTEPPGES